MPLELVQSKFRKVVKKAYGVEGSKNRRGQNCRQSAWQRCMTETNVIIFFFFLGILCLICKSKADKIQYQQHFWSIYFVPIFILVPTLVEIKKKKNVLTCIRLYILNLQENNFFFLKKTTYFIGKCILIFLDCANWY